MSHNTTWWCQSCGTKIIIPDPSNLTACPKCAGRNFANRVPPQGSCPECYQADQ